MSRPRYEYDQQDLVPQQVAIFLQSVEILRLVDENNELKSEMKDILNK